MSIDSLLSRLKKLKKTSPRTWLACCPAHEDRNPSMSVRLTEEGKTLLYCFAGCSSLDILGAVGMSIDELFDEPLQHSAKHIRGTKGFPRDALKLLQTEIMIVLLSAFELKKGKRLSQV